MLSGEEPPASWVKAMDVSLILYAEHEFNASAFAARVTVSTQSDLISGVVSAPAAGHVLERSGGCWILCAQEYGQYVWEVAIDRATALGGGAVGLDAGGVDAL